MDSLLTIIFFLFFVILFPLGELARIDLPNNIAISGIDFGVFIVTVLTLGIFIFKRNKVSFALLKPIVIFLGICLLSLLLNIPHLKQNEFFVSFLYLLRFACYSSIYFICRLTSSKLQQKVQLYMIVSGILLLLGGYLQYFFYPSLRNLYYLGWDVHLYRMFSSFLDPNFFGTFLVLYFLFLLSFVFHKKVGENKKLLFSLLFLLLLTLIGTVLTYSRSAYLMLAVGVITFFMLRKPSKKIITGGSIFMVIGLISFFTLTKYSEGTNLFRITSTEARLTTSENALVIFQKNPIFGVGFNAYRYAQNRYGLIDQTNNQVAIDHAGAGTDNSFLFVLATTGIVGFLAYLFLWWRIIIIGKTYKSPVLIAAAVALFADAFFINSLFYPFIMIWLWSFVGLTESK
jgi:O-antigen ligase